VIDLSKHSHLLLEAASGQQDVGHKGVVTERDTFSLCSFSSSPALVAAKRARMRFSHIKEDSMRFSVVQQKEMIEAGSGRFIGYIIDAEINEQSGYIDYFFVSQPRKFYQIMQGEESVKKVAISDILIIGKDVIIVKSVSV
jgi:sporulation protein YlmC with PRC-barrel domain